MGKTVVSKAGNAWSFPPHTWSVICRGSHLEYALIGRGGWGEPGWEDSESAAVLDGCSSCSFFSLPSLSSRSRIFVIVARTHERTLCAQESSLNLLLRCKARSFHATAVPRNCAFLSSLSLLRCRQAFVHICFPKKSRAREKGSDIVNVDFQDLNPDDFLLLQFATVRMEITYCC